MAVRASSAHAFPAHIHDEYGIGLIQRGAQRSRSGRGSVEAAAGDTITCNPGEVHDGHPIDGQERAWIMLYFEPAVVQSFAEELGHPATTVEFSQPQLREPALARLIARAFLALTYEANDEMAGEQLLMGVLAKLLRTPCGPVDAGPASMVRRAQAMIDEDPSTYRSLATLAEESAMNRFQLIRGFRLATGLTPHAYRVQRRLQLAKQLIGQGTPLVEAALNAGFADQSHFTRSFVRSFGLTPATFAKALRV